MRPTTLVDQRRTNPKEFRRMVEDDMRALDRMLPWCPLCRRHVFDASLRIHFQERAVLEGVQWRHVVPLVLWTLGEEWNGRVIQP